MKPLYAFSETPKRFRSVLDEFTDISPLPTPFGTKSSRPKQTESTNSAPMVTSTKVERTVKTTTTKSKHSKGSSTEYSYSYEIAIAILVLLCYGNATLCQFTFDDVSAIQTNHDLRPETPLWKLFQNDFWGQPMNKDYSHKSYRPLTVLSFRMNYYISGLKPFSYHLVNVILHLIVCLLFKKFTNTITSGRNYLSFVATVLFAVHPVHTEAVSSAVGRAETLSAIFFLTTLIFYARSTSQKCFWNLCLTDISILSFLVVCSTLSKEQGITVLAVCAVYEILYNQKISYPLRLKELIGRRTAIYRIVTLGLIGVIILLLRFVFVQSGQLPVFSRFDNPASVSESPVRQMTQNYLLAQNAWLLLFPWSLCADWTMGSIPLILSFTDPRNIATAAFYGVFFLLIWRAFIKNDRILGIALSFIVFPFLPASNLFFPVGFVIAERVLYLPSAGFSLIVALGITSLKNHFTHKSSEWNIFNFLLIAVLFAHSSKTILRNREWYNERDLFVSGLAVNPGNAKLYNNIGHTYEVERKPEMALKYYLQAMQIQPDDLGAYMNAGRMYAALNRKQEAEDHFLLAEKLIPTSGNENGRARIAPDHLMLFLHWARLVSKDNKRLAEAVRLLEKVVKMRPEFGDAWINLGEVLLAQNRTKQAQQTYLKALSLDPNNPDIHYNLGVVAIKTDNLQAAITHFERTLQLNPNHLETMLNYAIVIQDAGRRDLYRVAENILERLVQLEPDNERAFFHLGMLYMTLERFDDARIQFERAVSLRPDFRSATFNLALLLTNQNLNDDALPHLRRLIRHHPDHIKGLTLLGDLLINHAKDLNGAEDCYQRILRLDSKNIQAQHNLCVVFIEKRKLQDAEKCLEKALMIAPHEEYVRKHLKVLRARIATIQANKNSGK